ncbi:hypothetical protein BGX23_010443 [Mortierella sp. AD031]|nr:hypothetical protein BGX23_010443 [Mortierella sp. AD031]
MESSTTNEVGGDEAGEDDEQNAKDDAQYNTVSELRQSSSGNASTLASYQIIISFTGVSDCLPQVGYIFTTSTGILNHEKSRRRHTGRKVLGYFY